MRQGSSRPFSANQAVREDASVAGSATRVGRGRVPNTYAAAWHRRRVDEAPRFVFPKGVSLPEAEAMLAEAYSEIDEGKALRRTNKALRRKGIDPPMDVQYAAEPHAEETPDGIEVHLHPDILIYNEFPELDDCVDTFEDMLAELLFARLKKKVHRWQKRQTAKST